MNGEQRIPFPHESQVVVVRIDESGGGFRWFVGVILRKERGGYVALVHCPREFRRPVYEIPKKPWFQKRRNRKLSLCRHEREFECAWSGWTELPSDPVSVLFFQIASSGFLCHLKERFRKRADLPSETWREVFVSVENIFEANPRPLCQKMFA